MKNRVVVIIPIYKETIDYYEKISLLQALKVFRNYDICYISPNKIRKSHPRKNESKIEFFDDSDFASQRSYSDLLLTKEFYKRFDEYEYMLIYQLDAFVFYDKLDYFCDLNCDYIGAPMHSFGFYKAYDYIKESSFVGNGGASLRKIQSMIAAVDYYPAVRKKLGISEGEYLAEDLFFSFFGISDELEWKIPSIDVATGFAVEYDVNEVYSKIHEGNLPFLIHGWSKKQYINFWANYIRRYGYELTSDRYDYRTMYFEGWIRYRFAFFVLYDLLKKKLTDLNLDGKNVIIWGAGRRGWQCYDLLMEGGIVPVEIYDEKKKESIHGIEVNKPFYNLENYTDVICIITPKNADEEVKQFICDKEYDRIIQSIGLEEFICNRVECYYGKELWDIYKGRLTEGITFA